jgi:hypothetical protein
MALPANEDGRYQFKLRPALTMFYRFVGLKEKIVNVLP